MRAYYIYIAAAIVAVIALVVAFRDKGKANHDPRAAASHLSALPAALKLASSRS